MKKFSDKCYRIISYIRKIPKGENSKEAQELG